MSGLCHLDRASNVEVRIECQIFVIVTIFNFGQVLQFGAHSRYYKGASTQKRLFLWIGTTFRFDFHVGWKNKNKHSTLNLSSDAWSKWHEPEIKGYYLLNFKFVFKSRFFTFRLYWHWFFISTGYFFTGCTNYFLILCWCFPFNFSPRIGLW